VRLGHDEVDAARLERMQQLRNAFGDVVTVAFFDDEIAAFDVT
jgi:hypothetical protein